MEAIQNYGTPSRLRGDRGGENTKVAIWMRLWVEVGTQFARRWRAFFTQLGRLHRLDRKNPTHLWLLHHLFLQDINADCLEFQDEWNLHPMAGGTTNDQSPADLRFLGQLTEGVYRDDPLDDPLEGIHPDAINRYYGVEGRRLRRSRNQTGAGIASEEGVEDEQDDEDEWVDEDEELENRIEADLASNIRHAPVKVPRHRSPFKAAEDEQRFISFLNTLLAAPGVLPENFGVRQEEWDEEDYPETVVYRPGMKGKQLTIVLPREEWFPRAIRWARALDLMTRILHEAGDTDEDEDDETEDDD
ncbi:hypothetical protein C8F04DRAFT_1213036 [Mycena alexandri]|uniref:Integrase core domain-containing protein n=1 Tax=Mycena alexandri TaxID=1745969 RepID=A0AAD6WV00_9AGAR|nr:hypothetical protein C8F04DRAFT_1213036 [Mycena alexandri]